MFPIPRRKSGRKTLLCVVFTSSLWADSPLHAQDALAPVTLSDVVVKTTTAARSDQLNLDQPSTAGSRLNLTPLQTPASVSIIAGDAIRDRGDATINEAESRAVGVTAVPFSGNGNNSLSARGFYGPNSITQLYDGMQLFNAGGVVTFPFDPWNVERIDVLAGSSSVLYGTGGVGGALNVVPKDPDPTHQSGAIQGSFGSFKTGHGAFDITGPITPQLAYRFDISQYKSDGWVKPGGDSRSLAMSGALRFEVTPEFVVTLRDDYGNINPSDYEGTPTLNTRVIDRLRYTNFNVADGYIAFRENHVNLKEAWRVNDHLSLTNDTYVVTQYRRYHEGYMFAFAPLTNTVTRTGFRDISATQVQVGDHGFATINSQPFGLKDEMLVGFDINQSRYTRSDNQTGGSTGRSSVDAFAFDPGSFAGTGATAAKPQYRLALDQAGVFAENRLSLTDQVAVIAGVREDHYKTNLLTQPSQAVSTGSYAGLGYHFGLIYNPIPTLALYGRYAVSTDPVTSLASVGASQIQFGLSPAQQIEIGAKQTLFDDRLEATLALYRIVKQNLLTPTLGNAAISEVVGQQSSRGVEGSLSYRLTEDVRVEANGTILAARFDTYRASANGGVVNLAGYRPQFVPTRAANLLAHWSVVPGWELRGALRFVGDRFADNTDLYRLPAYTVLDLGLRWKATTALDVDLRVNNVTDRIYAVSAYAGSGTQVILGEPRSVTGTANYRF